MVNQFKFLTNNEVKFPIPYPPISEEHINLATPPEPNYDSHVINIVRRRMNLRLSWRGYQMHVFEPDGYPLLKIVSGINIGGMFHIVYLITRDGNTENYRVSVPLVNLQRRG